MQNQLNQEDKDQNTKQRIETCKEALKFLFYVNNKLQKSSDLDQKDVYQKSLLKWNLMKKEEQDKQQQKIENTKQKEQNILKRILQESERSKEIDISNLNSLQNGYLQVQQISNQLYQESNQELNHQSIILNKNINNNNNQNIQANEVNIDEIQVQSQRFDQQKPSRDCSDDEDYIQVNKMNYKVKMSKAKQSKSQQKRVLSLSKKNQQQNQELPQNVIDSYNCDNQMTIDRLKELMENMLKESV
ncbi:unnamed protein product [Paramecium pentaurelia]|uniref:Uncharacterized protein n=1 Tax=Paramecium pentaurelia TaxID=43138 RepID=A0A8S1VER2_9CILI|nr:unnamed protein product [Paramecium pentaurelia]